MRLTKRSQKTALLKWIAEGLSSTEIDAKAAEFNPPFSVSPQQVDYYRHSRGADLKAISSITEKNAMIEGYAVKEHRVYKLSILAALLEKDLFNGIIWTNQVKGIGGAENFEVVEYEEFNKAEIESYRGVLDDIAKETGGRVVKQEHTGKDGGPLIPEKDKEADARHDRALSSLADAIRASIPSTGTEPNSPMDTAK